VLLPVCSYRTMRTILAIAAHEDLELRQFDICTAFLNGELDEEVFMRPPAGAEHLAGGGRRVLRLRRALYGLRQASRAWNKKLEAKLKAGGFAQSVADPSLWIRHGEGDAVLAMFYVDDGLVAARTAAEADALVALVASMFAIRALGEPQDFLGIQITRDRSARTITIDQERKAAALAADMGVQGERRGVPMSPDTFAGLRAARPGEQMADVLAYQSAVGSLLHIAQCTRPDIALAVGALSAYNAAPTQAHFDAMLDVVRYVGSTAERGVTFGRTAVPLQIWCDANFAACQDTRRSTTGWVVSMYGGAVSWSSKKQATVAASTIIG
jgi:Reverse transcriptase (RNA-dependent DNA polymerase)